MKKNLVKKLWIVIQLSVLMLFMFFTFYIPCMFLLLRFLDYFLVRGMYLEIMVLFSIMGIGALFVCMAIVFRLTMWWDEVYNFSKKWDDLKKPLQKE